jgi:hypothetical protein
MSDDEEETHRTMMSDVSTWPGDYLHLKKPEAVAAGSGADAFGLLSGSDLLTVLSFEGQAIKRYDSLDALIADGWVVD